MESPSVDSLAGRPAKRRRHSSLPYENRSSAEPKMGEKWTGTVDLGKYKPTAVATAHSLTEEMNQILQRSPSLVSSAIELLDLYICLWECYVINSARKIHLEEEHRLLQDTNNWLLSENEQLRQVCNGHVLLLWDRQQAFHALRQGVIGILQSSERQPCQVENCAEEPVEIISSANPPV
ncbi:hypothetical protein N7490_006605 [Penicillium lividum]|nr:hypothetical protein N7490_006605 [Penicillium lividum]